MTSVTQLWKQIQAPGFDPVKGKDLVEQVKQVAMTSESSATVNFGTSGWRGEIGTEFTLRNIQVVGAAIVRMYKEASPELYKSLGIANFQELKERGLVIGHDNRLLGHEFCQIVAREFDKEGVKIYYGGEMATPEFSAAVEMLGAACSVNMTPSHNPSHYNGIKFNPRDGGPAGPEITDVITRLSNEMMASHKFEPLVNLNWNIIDPVKIYNDFLHKQGTIKFDAIKKLLDAGETTLVCDHVHGSTRGRPGAVLNYPKCLISLRTANDPLFGGVAPEPSSKNLEGVRNVLNAAKTKHRVGCIFDPDGDRVRFYDGTREIDMNSFGAMAFHYMYVHRKEQGCVAKSVATSNFVNIIAEKLGAPIHETAVGFKNFRPYLSRDAKEKALIALEIVATTGKNLGEYLDELYKEFGRLYPERSGFEVDKSLVGAPLVAKVNAIGKACAVGSKIHIGNHEKEIKNLLTLDGVKIIFKDDSWMLIRPSGTEPKVRIYTECRDANEKDAMFEAAKALFFKQ